jgi:glycosyltransferase involved in cell wall biosynthesis
MSDPDIVHHKGPGDREEPTLTEPVARRLAVAVGIASTGRADVLTRTIMLIQEQSRPPDRIIICVQNAGDIDETLAKTTALPMTVHFLNQGLCRQRNAILQEAADADILVFLDDDFLAEPSYVEEAERLFLTHADVVMATGDVLVDGINGPGLEVEEGLRSLRVLTAQRACGEELLNEVYNGYGCNMAFRLDVVRREKIAFDETLPLYCWLEDVDFSRVLSRHGRIVASNRLRGIHLGTKRGRTSGVRLGYSQVANPYYLTRKGTMKLSRAGRKAASNIAANLARSLWPESWIDRKGRLKGNALALLDLMRGRIAPHRILELD